MENILFNVRKYEEKDAAACARCFYEGFLIVRLRLVIRRF